MIDPNSETLISLADVAKHLPRRRAGKRPHISCIYRWTTSGCKGVILESIQVGGTRCTSKEALARFFNTLAQADYCDHVLISSVSQRDHACITVKFDACISRNKWILDVKIHILSMPFLRAILCFLFWNQLH
jgi:hypothetical protein